jgi:hypothetical protein
MHMTLWYDYVLKYWNNPCECWYVGNTIIYFHLFPLLMFMFYLQDTNRSLGVLLSFLPVFLPLMLNVNVYL